MKKAISYVAVFLVGVLGGGCLVSVLSVRAAWLYGQMLRSVFALEEKRALSNAWSKKDIEASLIHASCGAQLLKARAFDSDHSLWDITFPMMGFFGSKNTRYPVDDLSQAQGMAIARLGAVWEQFGRQETANLYYGQAAKLLGVAADAARTSGRSTLDSGLALPEMRKTP